jgi:hypothetical protein
MRLSPSLAMQPRVTEQLEAPEDESPGAKSLDRKSASKEIKLLNFLGIFLFKKMSRTFLYDHYNIERSTYYNLTLSAVGIWNPLQKTPKTSNRTSTAFSSTSTVFSSTDY